MKILRLILLVAAAGSLSACHDTPALNFSVTDMAPLQAKLDAELKSVSVATAGETEKQGSIDFLDAQVPALWQSALNDTMSRITLFKDDVANKVSLAVTILQFDVPAMGFDMVTDVAARYDLIDRASGKVIHTETVTNQGVVPMDYDFVGMTRGMESINRAVKGNIKAYIERLVANPPAAIAPAKAPVATTPPSPAAEPIKVGS